MTVRLTTGVFKQEFRFALPNRLLAENKGTWHLENQSKSYHHSPTGEMPGMRMNGISDVYFNGEVLP